MSRRITSLCVGRFKPCAPHDTLIIGTQSNIMAYDVDNNSDVFFKEVPDGVNACVFGHVSSVEAPLAVVGGNCSIQVL